MEKASPKYIFLEDTIGKSDQDLFSCQKFYDSRLPYRFIGLRKLLQELAGYAEILRFPYASSTLGVMKPLPMKNFHESKRIRYASSKKVDTE